MKEVVLRKSVSQVEQLEAVGSIKLFKQSHNDMLGWPNMIISQFNIGYQCLLTACPLVHVRSDIVTGWHVLKKCSEILCTLAYCPYAKSIDILDK